jgi:hypothetical protein
MKVLYASNPVKRLCHPEKSYHEVISNRLESFPYSVIWIRAIFNRSKEDEVRISLKLGVFIICCGFIMNTQQVATGLTLTQESWASFVGQAELVVWVKLIKWEEKENQYTRVSAGPTRLGEEGFLFLKQKDGKWEPAMPGRSYWPSETLWTNDGKTHTQTKLPEGLIYDYPEPIQKTKLNIKIHLHHDVFHVYETDVHLQSDVLNFLTKHVK